MVVRIGRPAGSGPKVIPRRLSVQGRPVTMARAVEVSRAPASTSIPTGGTRTTLSGTRAIVRHGPTTAEVVATREAQKFRQKNIRLDTGEWVDREEYKKLSRAEKDILKQQGTEAFSVHRAEEGRKAQEQLQFENVEVGLSLSKPQWIARSIFDELPSEEQAIVKHGGTDALDKYYNLKYITIKGKMMYRDAFFKLSKEDRQLVKDLGVTGFNKHIDKTTVLLASGERVDRGLYNQLNKHNQEFLNQVGFQEYNRRLDNVEVQLKPYTDKKGEVDIVKALKDTAVTPNDLKLVGMKDKTLKEAEHYASISKARYIWESMTPWVEWKGEKATPGGVGEMLAVTLIPGVWAKDWDQMDHKWRAINIAIDVAVLVPFIGWAGKAIKAGVVAGRAASNALKVTTKAAVQAGRAHRVLGTTLKQFSRAKIGSKEYGKLASNVQHASYASMKADNGFIKNLTDLTSVTSRQLARLERVSGLKGLKSAVLDVGKAQRELTKAWDLADDALKLSGRLKVEPTLYYKHLAKVQKAQAKLQEVLGRFDKVMRPRYKSPTAAGWDRVMWSTERELGAARKELERLLSMRRKGRYVDSDYLKRIQDDVRHLGGELDGFKNAKASGEMPPLPSAYKMRWAEEGTPEELLGDIAKHLEKQTFWGKRKPLFTEPPSGKRVAVATKEKITPETKVAPRVSRMKMEPLYKAEKGIEPTKARAPEVKAGVKPSVFPGIRAAPKAEERISPISWEAAAEWSRMPEAARRKVMEEMEGVVEDAIGIPVDLKKVGKEATKIAIRVATQAALQGKTRAEMARAVRTAIMEYVKTHTRMLPKTEAKAQAKPLTKLQVKVITKVAVKEVVRTIPKVRLGLRLRIPIIIIPLPSGDGSRRLTSEEVQGVVAWKQGWVYKLIFPPYGEKDIINTRTPIEGVKYHKGVGSAAQSIIAKRGIVPETIRRDMGIMDIKISTPRDSKKPTISFKRDVKQRTRVTPRVSSIRR